MGRRLETMRQREKRQSEKDDLIRGKKLKIGKEDRKIDIVVEELKSKSKSKVKDRISLLVDDILIHILSLLTIKEAQKTSVLSRRWKYLWTHRTCLDFYLDFTKYYDPREEKKFVNWVNEVLSSIQSPTIDHFIVHSSYVSHDVVTLDEWVDFATRKGVKNLELSMMDSSGHFSRGYFSSRPVLSGLKQLRSLVLKDINISGEDLQHFLLHCLSLEKLSIEGSIYLITLKIKGNPLHNLKMLKIFNNLYLEDLQICAPLPKLSSFQFQGLHRTHIYIASAPLLSHMYIGGCNGYDISYITGPFGQLSTQLSQIKTLELTLKTLYPRLVHQFPPSFKLSSLRELTVTVSTTQETYQRLCLLYSLLKSSPFLHKLKVEIQLLLRYDELLIIRVEEEEEEEEEEDALWTHQHLKVLEVAKFSENPVIVNFVKHIYRAAAHILEKIVIDPMPLHTHTTLLPSPTRILYTDHFEELFEEELITPPINQRIEFIL